MSLAISMFLILRQMYQHFLYGLCLLGEFSSKYYQYRTQKVNSKFASKTLKILFSTSRSLIRWDLFFLINEVEV